MVPNQLERCLGRGMVEPPDRDTIGVPDRDTIGVTYRDTIRVTYRDSIGVWDSRNINLEPLDV